MRARLAPAGLIGPAAADIRELGAGARAAEQQPPAAHVAAADEVGGKSQTLAQHGQERIDVLAGGDAAEQDDLARGSEPPGELSYVAVERPAIARIVALDVDGREALQPRQIDGLVGRPQTVGRRDDEDARVAVRWIRERARVRQLAAEVETAQKREDLAERRARGPNALGQLERRAVAQDHARPQPPAVGRREQKDPAHARLAGATARANSPALRVFNTSSRLTQPRRAIATP
jgi:hypothetical protein